VIPNAREVLLSLLEETRIKAESYERVPYNDHIIRLCDYRYKIVKENESVEAIEAALSAGQIEELVSQAEDEYDLLIQMNEVLRPWTPAPETDAIFATFRQSFGQTEKYQVWQRWRPDDSIWEEVDKELGLKTINTMTEEQWKEYIQTPEGKRTAEITSNDTWTAEYSLTAKARAKLTAPTAAPAVPATPTPGAR